MYDVSQNNHLPTLHINFESFVQIQGEKNLLWVCYVAATDDKLQLQLLLHHSTRQVTQKPGLQ
jgi:hypothetical protein